MLQNKLPAQVVPNQQRKNVYNIIASRFIALLERGVCPWRRTWSTLPTVAPQNFATKKPYRGLNYWLTMGFENPYFMTFKQIRENGGTLKKGSKAIPVVYWLWSFYDQDGKRCEEKDAHTKTAKPRYYRVFNLEMVEGIDYKFPLLVTLQDHQKIDRCEELVQGTGAKIITRGDQPAYSPLLDQIYMTDISRFETTENYYSVLFHELTHWTGHASRLNRFQKDDYATEELTAEMGAALLCAYCQIDNDDLTDNSAAYLQHWITTLQAQPKVLFSAASKAQRAADYLMG